MLCNQSPYSSEYQYDAPTITQYWYRDMKDARIHLGVTLTGEPDKPIRDETMFLCAAFSLLQAMPESGLEEACLSLYNIYEYHAVRPLKLLSAPQFALLKAKVKPVIQQPSFGLTED